MSTTPLKSDPFPLVPDAGAGAAAPATRAWHVAALLAESWDLQEVLGRVVAAGRDLVEADGAVVLVRDQESGLFLPAVPSVAVGMDERWLRRQGLEAIQAVAARVAGMGAPLSLAADQLGGVELPLLRGGRQPAQVLAAPLSARGAAIGALHLFWAAAADRHSAMDDLHGFATIAGPAIANAQEHTRQRQSHVQLKALDEASKAIAGELSTTQVLQRIVEIAAQLAQARYGALGVLGDDGYLSDFITTGISPEERARIGPLPRGVARRADPPRRAAAGGAHRARSQACRVPAESPADDQPARGADPPHNRVVGDLYLTDKVGGPEFTEDDQRLIELLAAHAGIAIENARLYAEMGELTLLRERERFARDLHDGIIQNIYAATLGIEDVAEDHQGGPRQRRGRSPT